MLDVRRIILIAVFGTFCGILSGCSTSTVSQSQTHIANTAVDTTTAKGSPQLNIEQSLVPLTFTKVNGWVPKDSGTVIIQFDGSENSIMPLKNGYYSGMILVPDIPPGTATIKLIVDRMTVLKKTVKVTNPYKP